MPGRPSAGSTSRCPTGGVASCHVAPSAGRAGLPAASEHAPAATWKWYSPSPPPSAARSTYRAPPSSTSAPAAISTPPVPLPAAARPATAQSPSTSHTSPMQGSEYSTITGRGLRLEGLPGNTSRAVGGVRSTSQVTATLRVLPSASAAVTSTACVPSSSPENSSCAQAAVAAPPWTSTGHGVGASDPYWHDRVQPSHASSGPPATVSRAITTTLAAPLRVRAGGASATESCGPLRSTVHETSAASPTFPAGSEGAAESKYSTTSPSRPRPSSLKRRVVRPAVSLPPPHGAGPETTSPPAERVHM
mmetsp:Transcript_34913/g.110279  ORF Transcript_34913/g.110279 Transcript_34913/m.110279 type:complete len:305 (-) Transcript_34913:1633-2547(-)